MAWSIFVVNRIYNEILDRDWFFAPILTRNRHAIMYLYLDTNAIRTSITCAVLASFLMFPAAFKSQWNTTDIFVQN